MRKALAVAWRLIRGLPLALLSPILVFTAVIVLALADFATMLTPRREAQPDTRKASIVIPNWNGRDLLAKYLPSVAASIENHPESEIIVVDNGSTDGSVAFIEGAFPDVRVLPLKENLGFGGGSNAGFRAAHNDIVVLLNSDMRVEPDFLQPLLDGFTDEKVFSVSCQIFFSDPAKVRQETGLTES
ncbi:MAG: glycosyltransferase, partial [Bryobacteraceae bacterium]